MREIIDFNYDWQFNTRGGESVSVTIPHTPRIETLDVSRPFQGKMWYKKTFVIPDKYAGSKMFIDFEGVMSRASIYINGVFVKRHIGGYLPFSVDITNYIKLNLKNSVTVIVDNRDSGAIPPGKPTRKVDFLYFGGVYRNVWLRIVDKVHIPPAVTGSNAEGGVYVDTERVSDGGTAYLNADVYVKNCHIKAKDVSLKCRVLDADNAVICRSETAAVKIREGATGKFNFRLEIADAELWSIERPYRYRIVIEVFKGDEKVDEYDMRYGIRTVSVDGGGFKLNGKYIRINGANRHQQYPYVGIAASAQAETRDIALLKEAGFNTIRLSHYPQSEAVLEACDSMGLLVMEPVPGWQHCQFGIFRKRVLDNIRDMARRDRNRCCVVLWETSLNETGKYLPGATDRFFRKCVKRLKRELPRGLTCGDALGRGNVAKIGYDVAFTGWDNQTKTRISLVKGQRGLTREYGDYEFGGHNSTSRVARGQGERALQLQAWNFQWSHNKNLSSDEEIGDIIWEGIDHNRGMASDKPISTSGILDVFRIPKFSYHFFRSQRDDIDVVSLATYWSGESDTVCVYSNCDKVRLLLNGKVVGEKTADIGADDAYVSGADSDNNVDYWVKGLSYESRSDKSLAGFTAARCFNGGNCAHLKHPPFTFRLNGFESGKLVAEGLKKGEVRASACAATAGKAVSLKVEADDAGIPLAFDGRDFVFVRAYLEDADGNIAVTDGSAVEFRATGGEILGDASPVAADGIASVLVRAYKDAESVKISARLGEAAAECVIYPQNGNDL